MTRASSLLLATVALGVLALVATGAAACSRSDAAPGGGPAYAPLPTGEGPGARPKLVFFMNPNGHPCQIQDRILDTMAKELRDRVDLVYYRTTHPGDIAKFDQYGIRSLPALIVTDAAGKELRRATPGIQGAAAVRRLIAP
jgi:thioredoxin 1